MDEAGEKLKKERLKDSEWKKQPSVGTWISENDEVFYEPKKFEQWADWCERDRKQTADQKVKQPSYWGKRNKCVADYNKATGENIQWDIPKRET